jgi:hypothetical protein
MFWTGIVDYIYANIFFASSEITRSFLGLGGNSHITGLGD